MTNRKTIKNVRTGMILFLSVCLIIVLGASIVTVSASSQKIPAEVQSIINERCVRCHTGAPASHVQEHPGMVNQCGSCHVPVQVGHDTEGCVECHETPGTTHFFLRDVKDQTVLAANAEGKCIKCHIQAKNNIGKGYPALDSNARIIKAAEKGTLRSWIQRGGFMAKYLSPEQAATVSKWIDSIAQKRELGYDPYLQASRVSNPPVIDGDGSDKAWSSAKSHTISLTPAPPFTDTDSVELKALYDDTNLYILAVWKDSTLSMTRAGSWKWMKTGWMHPEAAGENDKQSEDRLAILWNMTTPDFRTVYGCAVKCHGNVPGSSEFTDKQGSKMDIWHTKAARGMGGISAQEIAKPKVAVKDDSYEATAGEMVFNGWLDDKYLVWYMDLEDGYNLEDSGRRGDKGQSAYSHNRNKAKNAPAFMEKAPENYPDAMVLTQSEVAAGEVLVADPDSPDYAGDKAVNKAWRKYAAAKAVVPERVLRHPAGSRADVKHSATWKDGVWVNEFQRALNTGSPGDDVIFDDLSKEYEYSIAVFDNCGRGEIPPGHNTYGDGQYQLLTFK
ncbi:MAG: ethylbenzene dehydrogenase-related protein [bacterium]|nr:ethylbenzene dehydrogenase-related protein [bacterium]